MWRLSLNRCGEKINAVLFATFYCWFSSVLVNGSGLVAGILENSKVLLSSLQIRIVTYCSASRA